MVLDGLILMQMRSSWASVQSQILTLELSAVEYTGLNNE